MQQATQTDKDLRRILAKSLLIPSFVDLALPMLEICNGIDEIRYKELIDKLSSRFHLTQEERIEQLQSGQAVIANRVYWCVTHLKKAGLLEGKRGIVSITPAGKDALLQNLKKNRSQVSKHAPSIHRLESQFWEEIRCNKGFRITYSGR